MTATRMSRQVQGQAATSGLLWLLFVLDAALLIASGVIHFHLWDEAYHDVATLDVLFIVQGVACILAAIVLLITRHLLIVAGCALLMAGTIVGFLVAKTVGVFGFKLPYVTHEAWAVLAVEAVAIVMLVVTGLLLNRQRSSS